MWLTMYGLPCIVSSLEVYSTIVGSLGRVVDVAINTEEEIQYSSVQICISTTKNGKILGSLD